MVRVGRPRRIAILAAGIAAGCVGTACGASAGPIPSPIGAGSRYHPDATSREVAHASAVGRFRCSATTPRRARFHLELFAHRRAIIVPAGIGVAPPLLRSGAYVRGGRCTYALHTLSPTGVVEFDAAATPTLGDLFRVWGQPLGPRRLLTFRGRVHPYVAGHPWHGPVAAIPLRHHAQIVLEVAGYVPPHPSFLFGAGS